MEINSQSASYTLQESDFKKTIEVFSSASTVLTIPDDPSISVGFYFNLTQTGTGNVLVSPGSGVTIYAEDNDTLLFSQFSSAYIYKRSMTEWVLIKSKASLVLKSPENNLFQITVENDGSLRTAQI